MWIVAIIGVVLLIVAAVLLWSGRRTQGLVNLFREAVPTRASRVAESFPGELVSLSGVARSERELISQQAQQPCIYYEYAVVREYEESRTSRSSGSRGGSRTTRHRGSETVADHREWVPFYVEDETGRARVNPQGATFDARQVVNRFAPGDDSFGGMALGNPMLGIGGRRTLGYRYTESIIPADAPVFVLGCVDEQGELATPGRNRTSGALIVSYRDEESLRDAWARSARWQAYGSIAAAAAGLVLILIAAGAIVL